MFASRENVTCQYPRPSARECINFRKKNEKWIDHQDSIKYLHHHHHQHSLQTYSGGSLDRSKNNWLMHVNAALHSIRFALDDFLWFCYLSCKMMSQYDIRAVFMAGIKVNRSQFSHRLEETVPRASMFTGEYTHYNATQLTNYCAPAHCTRLFNRSVPKNTIITSVLTASLMDTEHTHSLYFIR